MIYTADYITHDDAETYFATRLYAAAFLAASDADMESALHMATQAINGLPLKGWKANPATQENAFPRYIPLARGGFMGDGVTVPTAVTAACCEEALELITTGNNSRRSLQDQGVASFRMLDLSETFAPAPGQPTLTSRMARQMMRPYIAAGVPIV